MTSIIRLLILLMICLIQIKAQAKTNPEPGFGTEGNILCCAGSLAETTPKIKVYPSPTSEYIKVEGTTEGAELLLYNDQGKLLISTKASEASTLIRIRELEKGTYYLRYRTEKSRFTDRTLLVI